MELFKDKTVIISGGAEGIGLAIAKAVGLKGMNVVLGDVNAEGLKAAEQQLTALGIAVATQVMDVTKAADWEATVALAKSSFGAIHALVNNAGCWWQACTHRVDLDERLAVGHGREPNGSC